MWAQELVPAQNTTSIAVSLSTFDSGSLAFICLYFLLISKDWFPLMLVSVIMSVISLLICAILLPESPIWLLQNGREQEAIAAFNFIGKINGV